MHYYNKNEIISTYWGAFWHVLLAAHHDCLTVRRVLFEFQNHDKPEQYLLFKVSASECFGSIWMHYTKLESRVYPTCGL